MLPARNASPTGVAKRGKVSFDPYLDGSNFLDEIVHELRSPLWVLRSYLKLLQDGSFGKLDAAVLEVLHESSKLCHEALNLVNSILTYSKLKANKINLNLQLRDISEVICSVVRELDCLLRRKGLIIEVKMPSELSAISFDEEKIKTVL